MFVCWRLEATFYPPTCSWVVIDHLGTGIFGMFKHTKVTGRVRPPKNGPQFTEVGVLIKYNVKALSRPLDAEAADGADGFGWGGCSSAKHLLFDWSFVTDGNRTTIFCAWSLGNRASWWNSSKDGLLRDSFQCRQKQADMSFLTLDGFHPFRSIENNPCILQ